MVTTTKRHECILNEYLIREIEYILPRLKYSVYIQQVKHWLENFEANEVGLALDFLFYLEYISFAELQSRLDEQLKNLVNYFPADVYFLFAPFAKYPKSSDLIMYLLTKSKRYKELERKKRASFTRDLANTVFKERSIIVFVDDFIGSGKSFKKWFYKSKIQNIIGSNKEIYHEQALIAAIIMENGAFLMSYCFPEVQVFAQFRSKVFCKKYSPFNLSESRNAMKELGMKYGKILPVGFVHPNKVQYAPLGYEKCESLIAFDYGVPNNSLPIIWADSNWKPIFPRSASNRMKQAKAIKAEAAFFLGVMHRLNIQLDEDISIDIENKSIGLNAKDDHSILVYLILKQKHFADLQICQVLGITLSELNAIIKKASEKKVVNKVGEITRAGVSFIRELKKKANIFRFRDKGPDELKEDIIYLPKTFRNMT